MGSVTIYVISSFIKVQIELLIFFKLMLYNRTLKSLSAAYQLRSKYLLLFVKEITQLFTNSRLYSVVGMLFVICMDLVVNDHLDLGLVL